MSTLQHKRIITLIVSSVLFMDALDATIINTAIPSMAKSLLVNPLDLKIALISYLITLAIFIPTSGWLADKYGIKKIFILALTLFTLSSLWCGYASSLTELVISRCFQGAGGSLMLPLGRLLLLRTFPRHEFINVMNQVIIVLSLGLMLGPFVGGFITDHLSWHWIFWINLPIGICAIMASLKWLKDDSTKLVKPFDLIGFILFSGGLATLTYSLSDLSESMLPSFSAYFFLGSAITLLISFFVYSRHKESIINLQLLQIRTFKISILGNLFARLGFGGIPFLLPLFLQINLHFTAEQSGLLIAPIALGVLIIKYFSTRLLRLLGYKKLLLTNTFLVGISIWMFMLITTHTSVILIVLLTFIFGSLISLQYSGMNSLAYSDIGPENHSAAVTIISTTQQLAQGLGVACAAFILRYYSLSYSTKILTFTTHEFHFTFLTMGFITMLSTVIFIRLHQKDGYQMLAKTPEI